MFLRKRHFAIVLCSILFINGCVSPDTDPVADAYVSATGESAEDAVQMPDAQTTIVSIGDLEIPYELYRHYYNAGALKAKKDSSIAQEDWYLPKVKQYAEELLLNDCIYQVLASMQEISLSEEEANAIDDTVDSLNLASDDIKKLQRFRLESEALKDKIYITLYTPDFMQSAVHVKCLFIPYGDANTEEDKKSKNQLASLISTMGNSESKTLDKLTEAADFSTDVTIRDIYLTRGDMGEGVYELAAGLKTDEISQPFTLDNDGVYLMQRIITDEAYVKDNIADLLAESEEFTSLYRVLLSAVRQTVDIAYTDAFDHIPLPEVNME